MTALHDQWIEIVSGINTWKRGNERAPHKPLMLLMLLARAYCNESQQVTFEELNKPLEQLLREFGPTRSVYHPEQPFWYLQSDGFWVVDNADQLPPRRGSSNPTKNTLIQNNAVGHVPDELWSALTNNQQLIYKLTRIVLDVYWPSTLHFSICQAVGLPDSPPEYQIKKRKRDPRFRTEVLRAYEGRCAVCGYDGRLSNMPLGLEAAHIRWHAYSGPDDVSNGLALCSYHHVAFDSGALGVDADNKAQVSADVTGSNMVGEWLLQFIDQPLRKPIRSFPVPDEEHIHWHRREVFKMPAR